MKIKKVTVEFDNDSVFELDDFTDITLSEDYMLNFSLPLKAKKASRRNMGQKSACPFKVGDLVIGRKGDRTYAWTNEDAVCRVMSLINDGNSAEMYVKVVKQFPEARVKMASGSLQFSYPVHSEHFQLYKFKCEVDESTVQYTSNVTVVKLKDGSTGKATCLPEDFYDEEVGYLLAYARAKEAQNSKRNKK